MKPSHFFESLIFLSAFSVTPAPKHQAQGDSKTLNATASRRAPLPRRRTCGFRYNPQGEHSQHLDLNDFYRMRSLREQIIVPAQAHKAGKILVFCSACRTYNHKGDCGYTPLSFARASASNKQPRAPHLGTTKPIHTGDDSDPEDVFEDLAASERDAHSQEAHSPHAATHASSVTSSHVSSEVIRQAGIPKAENDAAEVDTEREEEVFMVHLEEAIQAVHQPQPSHLRDDPTTPPAVPTTTVRHETHENPSWRASCLTRWAAWIALCCRR